MDYPRNLPLFGRRNVISSLHPLSLGGIGLSNVAPGSATWTAANRALYIPFRVIELFPYSQLYLLNGSAVSGNADVGIYAQGANGPGRRLVSSGSTAQAGISVNQAFDVTDGVLDRGLYYWANALDNTTGTIQRIGNSAPFAQIAGAMMEASAFPLPATATPIATTANALPVIAVTGGSL